MPSCLPPPPAGLASCSTTRCSRSTCVPCFSFKGKFLGARKLGARQQSAFAPASKAPPERVHVMTAALQTEREAAEKEVQIEGISRDYCSEFECTSSPAVEQNVKALARDITRLTTWTTSIFAKDVSYSDPMRSFTGIDKYGRLKFPADCMKSPKVLVTKLKMLDRGTCVVEWRLRGSIGFVPVDVDMQSEFTLDLITGRVTSHRERWGLGRCGLPGRAAWSAARALWSAQQASRDTTDTSGRALKRLQSRSQDDDQGIYANPNDPTKFFQQDDNQFKDALSLATLLALLWLIASAYFQVEQLH